MDKTNGNKQIIDLNSANKLPVNNIDISFNNLTYIVKQTKQSDKTILNNITGIFKSGQVNCIMGASGAGKTSLLNILACRINDGDNVKIQGQLLANGKPYNQNNFNDFSAYVMQSDKLMPTLTPRECLMFVANLKFKGSQEEKIAKVNETLRAFKLEKCSETMIGGVTIKGVSGGERKRTSVAVELMTSPEVLMLDEPTSGLDSFTSYLIIKIMKDYALTGKTVIFTIHQPNTDIYELFDRLLLLVEGKLIYQSISSNAISYFSSIGYPCPKQSNPTDYFMEIMHPQFDEANKQQRYQIFFDSYQKRMMSTVQDEVNQGSQTQIIRGINQSSFIEEFKAVAWRSIINQKRNPILFNGRIAQTIFLGLLTGLIYLGQSSDPFNMRSISNIQGALYFLVTNMFMGSFQPVILTFSEERLVFLKEVNGKLYGVTSYFLGKTFPEMVAIVIIPILMAIIAYWMIGLNYTSSTQPLTLIFICIVLSFCGNSMGLALGSAFEQPKVIQTISPLIFIPMMLFSGFYANGSTLASWISWFQYISPFKWGFEAFIQNQYNNQFLIVDPPQVLGMDIGCWNSVLYLFIISCVTRIAALLFLKLSVKNLQ